MDKKELKELCDWLKLNSSGDYRNCALAAHIIETMEEVNSRSLDAMIESGEAMIKAGEKIQQLEQQLSDLSKTNSEIKAEGIIEAVEEAIEQTPSTTLMNSNHIQIFEGRLLQYANNLIKLEKEGE